MPTPVGPVPRDPNDPDFWDWEPDDSSTAARHPGRAIVAALVVVAMILFVVSVVT